MSRLERLDQKLFRAGLAAAVLCLVAVTFLTFAQVVSRYFLRYPLTWSEELATGLFIWLTTLGGAAALHQGAHYGFSLLVDKSAGSVRRCMLTLAGLTTLAVCLLLAWLGFNMTLEATNLSSALRWPMNWFYAAIPVGATLGAWHVLVQLIAVLRKS